MKKRSFLYSLLLPLSLYGSANAALISYWDFNDGFALPDDTVQFVHSASQGSGTIYQQRADTDGNGKQGVAFVDAANGINATSGKGMGWNDVGKGGDNDAEFFIVINTSGFTNIKIRFDLLGNNEMKDGAVTGIQSYDLKYSTATLVDVVNPPDVTGTIKDFDTGSSTSIENNTDVFNPQTFTEVNVDLSATTAVNDQSYVALRFDDWKENDDMSIDNVLVTGTAVPEPQSAMLALVGSFFLLLRKRR